MDRESGYSPAFAEAVGRTIKVIRTDLGIDRRTLAERAGISYSYLTEIENGNKPPSSSVLRQIAGALGMRMSQLTEAAELRLEAQSAAAGELLAEFGPLYDRTPPTQPDAPASGTTPAVGAGPAAPVPLPPFSLETRDSVRSRRASSRDWAMQPSLRGPDRELRSIMLEMERLLRRMAPDDIQRLLDFARRLAR